MHTNVRADTRSGFVWVAAAAAIVLFLALRNTDLLMSPRFWGEEGEFYFQPACTHSLWYAITACPQDYYNLGCRMATLLALAVPLEHAPLVTTLFALLVQALPGLLILRLAQRRWFGPWTAVAAVATVLLGSPMYETWLTSTSSAYYLLLAGALTICCHEQLGLRMTAWCLALATGLSSTYSIGLLPFAAWLAVRQPSRGRTIVTLMLLLGLLLQTVAYLTREIGGDRTQGLTPAIAVAAFFAKVYVLPVGGLEVADRTGVELSWAIYEQRFWRLTPLLLLPVLAMWACILASGSRVARQLFVCGHLLAITALVGSLGNKHELIGGLAGGRYFVPISSLHVLGALEALRQRTRWWIRVLPAVFVGAALLQGFRQYFDLPPGFYQGPDWRAEVAEWRRDPSHAMAIWPANSTFRVRLPPQ